jgi:hypothetical protein
VLMDNAHQPIEAFAAAMKRASPTSR